MCTCMLTLLTLAKLEEARGEYGRTEKPEKDGTTDQLEAGVLSLCSKPLTQTMESVTKITVHCKLDNTCITMSGRNLLNPN